MNGNVVHSITALKRWSCQDKQLPPVDRISNIHVYDFDNTLFASPLPNKQLWTGSTCGSLQAQEFFYQGGWWHNPKILGAVGAGIDIEEPRAWQGCWNENIVDLVRLSMADSSTLTVLLTGRSEAGFAELIEKMLKAKSLEFDITALKPTVSPTGQVFSSTLAFKETLLRDLVSTYGMARELRIYEDRVKHVKSFRDFFEGLKHALASTDGTSRPSFDAEVIQVSEQEISMDPEVEVAVIQEMINTHNQAIIEGVGPPNLIPWKIKRSVFYTGYLMAAGDSEKLNSLVHLPEGCPEHEVRRLANNILITPRPAPSSILQRVGGLGAKMSWRVTGVASYEDRVWAARVEPTIPNAQIYTENDTPCVVLATRRQARPVEASHIQNWHPVPASQAFEFTTTVGEKALLRIDEEFEQEDAYQSRFPNQRNQRNSRKHDRDEDFPPLGSSRSSGPWNGSRPQHRGNNNSQRGAWSGRGGAGGFANGPRGGANSGRGAYRGGNNFGGARGRRGGRGAGRGGPRGGYKSLDDSSGQAYGSGGMQY